MGKKRRKEDGKGRRQGKKVKRKKKEKMKGTNS